MSSRYVLLLRTGVEKGFMIFLIATDVPESWSLAELRVVRADQTSVEQCAQALCLRRLRWPALGPSNLPNEAEGTHAYGLEVDITSGDLEHGSEDR